MAAQGHDPATGEATFAGAGPLAPRIGDRLRLAREQRGITIAVAAAALRIRAPILEALEREDHGSLPPRVYVIGHLRSYATYLNLDPGTVVAGWPQEGTPVASDSPADGASTGFRVALGALRPRLVGTTRSVLAFGSVGAAVLLISGFLLVQALRLVLPPAVTITYPASEISTLPAGTLSVELRGVADPRASIIVDTSAGAQVTAESDASGLWQLSVPLGTGRTEVSVRATKLGATGETSAAAERVFIVALPDKVTPEITITLPTPDQAVQDFDVPISLQTDANAVVEVAARDVGGELLSARFSSDANGAVRGGMPLPAGRWTISFSVTGSDGSLSQATRTVVVSYRGATVGISADTVPTWIRVWIDGELDPSVGASGRTIRLGERLLFTGEAKVEVRSADPSILTFTLNGRTIRVVGQGGGAETYAFLKSGTVQRSSRR